MQKKGFGERELGVKKGKLYEGTVTGYRFPNKGKTEAEGCPVLVKDALPGQKISFIISHKRSGTSEGRLIEVLERSPLEDSEPLCPYFGECGGCSYQRISYEHQIALKSGLVKDLISSVYPEFEFEGITESPARTAYRNKMEFSFGDETKGGNFALGLHRKGSYHDIINIRQCAIVHDDFDKIRNAVRDYFNTFYIEKKVDFYNQYTHKGYLRHLLIRRSIKTGEILAGIVTADAATSECLSDECETGLLEGMKNAVLGLNLEGRVVGICHVKNNAMSDIVKNEGMEILFGQDFITEEVLGLKFKISVFSFFQTNTLGCEKLYDKAREFAAYKEGGVIYDLYSGTGTIAQLMSPAASKVIGVEIVEDAVESAIINASLNGIENVEFIAGDVMKVLCEGAAGELPEPDLIILDPPREGIHPKALGRILGFGVEKIVYISCKPTSLATDLTAFKNAGYVLEKAACVDMFPNTVHVETVVILVRKTPDAYVRIKMDMEDFDRTKSEAKE